MPRCLVLIRNMKNKCQVTIALLATLILSGCGNLNPIRTDAEYTPSPEAGQPAFKYGSEKDIIYTHESTTADGSTVKTEINVLASAAAYADAKRQSVQAQSNLANAQLATQALQTLIPLVSPLPDAIQSPTSE